MTIKHSTLKKTLLAPAILAFAGLGSQGAMAATETDNQVLTAVNQTTCTVSVPDIDFGTVTDKTEYQQAFQVTVECPVDMADLGTLTADGGNNIITIPRRMKGDLTPSDYMNYDIYIGPTYTGAELPIGDDALTHPGSSITQGAGSTDFVAVIHSVVTSRTPGNYTDTVVWTLTF